MSILDKFRRRKRLPPTGIIIRESLRHTEEATFPSLLDRKDYSFPGNVTVETGIDDSRLSIGGNLSAQYIYRSNIEAGGFVTINGNNWEHNYSISEADIKAKGLIIIKNVGIGGNGHSTLQSDAYIALIKCGEANCGTSCTLSAPAVFENLQSLDVALSVREENGHIVFTVSETDPNQREYGLFKLRYILEHEPDRNLFDIMKFDANTGKTFPKANKAGEPELHVRVRDLNALKALVSHLQQKRYLCKVTGLETIPDLPVQAIIPKSGAGASAAR